MSDYGKWETEALLKEAKKRGVIVAVERMERDELQVALEVNDVTGKVFVLVSSLITINFLGLFVIFMLVANTYVFGIDLDRARLYAAMAMLFLNPLFMFPVLTEKIKLRKIKESLAEATETK